MLKITGLPLPFFSRPYFFWFTRAISIDDVPLNTEAELNFYIARDAISLDAILAPASVGS